MRIAYFIAIGTLLAPGLGMAASREQQEMQRDIAQLQDQVRALQSGFDQKISALQALVEQALEAGNKVNTNVSVLSSSVTQTLDRELRERLTPVAGLSAKLDNANNDIAEVRNSVTDLNTQVNKILQLLGDVNMAIKVIQAPPAAPPPATGAAVSAAPPPAAAIYGNAVSDYNSGKSDLAASEFADFIRFYPDDPFAINAQQYIGQIHYAQGKFDQAVQDFDAVLERYPENTKVTPSAYFQKGMALKQAAHRDAAVVEFRTLIKKYPTSDDAKNAREQLRSLGLSAGPAAAPAPRRR